MSVMSALGTLAVITLMFVLAWLCYKTETQQHEIFEEVLKSVRAPQCRIIPDKYWNVMESWERSDQKHTELLCNRRGEYIHKLEGKLRRRRNEVKWLRKKYSELKRQLEKEGGK